MNSTEEFLQEASSMTSGLFYISETDALVEPFCAGSFSGDLRGDIVRFSGAEPTARIETNTIEAFFSKVSKRQDWHTPAQSERADRFRLLGEYINANLRDTLLVRIGETRIQIFVAGRDEFGNICGVKTVAVET